MPVEPSKEATVCQLPHVADAGLRALLSFHGEIRAALKQLAALAAGLEPRPHEAAIALVRFFEGPFAWHDLDEEASLLPRLRRLPDKPADLDEMLHAVSEDHEALESYVERLMPHLEAVARGDTLPDHGVLLAAARDLRRMLNRHLALEERTVFPLAISLLTVDDKRSLDEELRRRREGREGGHQNAVPVTTPAL